MNDNPHLMALIDAKMAQARTSRQHGDGEHARDLLDQVRIYAAALGADGTETGRGLPVAGAGPPGCW